MANVAEVERPSGSFTAIKHDGFEIQSNVGTEDDLRADLGLEVSTTEAAVETKTDTPPLKAKVANPRNDPKARRQSIQAEIDADIERKRIAKEEADAEEARLTKLREEAKQYSTRRQSATPRVAAPIERSPAPKPSEYDGTDPQDPEPKIEQFAEQVDPYTAYLRAVTQHDARKEWRKQNHQQQQTTERQYAQQVYSERDARIRQSFTDAAAKDPNFKLRIDPDIATSLTWGGLPEDPGTLLGNLIADETNPVDYLVYFSEHKQDFQRISALHPLLQGVAFGEIKGRLAAAASPSAPAPKPKPASQAKPPVKALGATPHAVVEDERPDEELSDEEHDARYSKFRRQYR